MTDLIKKQYPVARLHKFLQSAPQFRPIRRGARRKGIERKYYSNDGKQSLVMRLFYELDIADQDLLLCLIAISAVDHKSTLIGIAPKNPINIDLRAKLELKGDNVTEMQAIGAHATAYEILNELGKKQGKSGYDWLEGSLNRLSSVSFTFKTEHSIDSFHLVSWSASLNEKGRMKDINFSINPYSARAVLGESGGYVLLHRDERAVLKSEESRGLHAVLCGLCDMGKDRTLSLDMLSDKVYSRYDEQVSADAMNKRRKKIAIALNEINELDYWDCLTSGRGKQMWVNIKRKRYK